MWIFIPPPGSGPTVGDIVEALEDFTWKDGVILAICLIFSWVLAYSVIGYFNSYEAPGLLTISFIMGNFGGIFLFVIASMLRGER